VTVVIIREGNTMPTYIGFYKLTDEGAKAIKTAPARIEAAIQAWEGLGGKLVGFYVCHSGEYDYVAIGEAPSDEIGKLNNLALEAQGNARVTATRVYTRAEFAEMVAKLP
jgi:uncharacterized protein with GYD domain